jgi:phosphosulfolactate synthase
LARERNAFAGVIADPLAGRSAKPRTAGQTMVLDKGLGLSHTGDLLELAAPYIDYMKLGFGTPALYRAELLKAKIELIRSHGVEPYPGGTFLEVAWVQGKLPDYFTACERLGFRLVEVSDGTITLSAEERQAVIRSAQDRGLTVITEVGKKAGEVELDPVFALRQISADLEAGAVKVIVEGRETGQGAGLYDMQGRVKGETLEVLAVGVADPATLLWETPAKEQQQALISRFGPNVNLGNIAPADVIALEALRRGLRSDTLKLALEGVR